MADLEKLALMDTSEANEFDTRLKCAGDLAAMCAECVNRGDSTAESYDGAITGLYFYLLYLAEDFSRYYQRALEALHPDAAETRREFGAAVRFLEKNPEVLAALEREAEKKGAVK